jgi:hypothetical protein
MIECPALKHFYSLHLPAFIIISIVALILNYWGAMIHEEKATYYFYHLSLLLLFECFGPSHLYVFIISSADFTIYISCKVIDFLVQVMILRYSQ